MVTLGLDVSLSITQNCFKMVQGTIIKIDLMLTSRPPLIDGNRMRSASVTVTAPMMHILRDLGEFIEKTSLTKYVKKRRIVEKRKIKSSFSLFLLI